MEDFTKLRKCKVLLENCGVPLRRCSVFLTKIDSEKESRRENFLFPKTKKKFHKKKLRERFIVSSKYRKKKLIVKYELSLPGKPVASLGNAVVQEEAFEFPSEEINIEPSPSRDTPQVFFATGKPGDQIKIDEFKDGTELVNIVDLNRNQHHEVNLNTHLSDEILHS